ncbi:MAG: UDP-N-acetylglucosamine 2-epimerase (hydrolyzing) [Anaerolineae bacterium]|nr:UDP-N-acetylglucosamine 2-epimerase (hydrolyzing) [Anaerolineae bacterium]
MQYQQHPKRKICIVVGSRANYSSIKSVMRAIQKHPALELQLVVGASALLDRYGSVVDIIETDGFKPLAKVHMIIEGETPVTMAKSTGLGLLELPNIFDNLKPDIVLTVGDRFETIATAISAAYMNIPLAHTMGGEVTGTIDESVRHAVTKLAHIHFPANKGSAERIIRMGEDPQSVFVVGCPRIDLVAEIVDAGKELPERAWLEYQGVGGQIDLDEPFLLVAQYPVTTEYGQGEFQINETLMALRQLDMPTIMLWPNADAGSEDVARGIRKFRERYAHENIRFYKNFPPETFMRLINRCACMIGNSSSAIREGAFMGTPAVNIGTRQAGREQGKNVINVSYNQEEICDAVKKQLKNGRYPSDPIYGDGHAGERIANILSTIQPNIQKRMTY